MIDSLVQRSNPISGARYNSLFSNKTDPNKFLLAEENQPKTFTRTDRQDHALSMGCVMFGIILDRFLALTQEAITQRNAAPTDRLSMDIFPEDAKMIFPAIKVYDEIV